MTFKDNFSEILLIAEQPVIFYLDDPNIIKHIEIKMNLLSIADTLTNPYVQYAIALFNMTYDDLKKQFRTMPFKTKWEFILNLRKTNNDMISRCLIYCFQKCFGKQFNAEDWTIQNFDVDEAFFTRIEDILLISSGLKDYKDQQKFNNDKPQWLIDKENEIKRIKNQGKLKTGSYNDFNELLKVLVPLTYELNYSFEQLFAMNYFHIKKLAEFIPKIINYDIGKRQIMSKKKIKYITEK